MNLSENISIYVSIGFITSASIHSKMFEDAEEI